MSNAFVLTGGMPGGVNERVVYLADENGEPKFIETADDCYQASKTLIGVMSFAGVSGQVVEQLTPFLFDAGEQMGGSGLLDVHVVVALDDGSFFIAGYCRPPTPGDRIRESMLTLVANYRGEVFDIAVVPTCRAIKERAGMFGMQGVAHVH